MNKILQKIFSKVYVTDVISVNIDLGENWIDFENGNTIGKKGSEKGKILCDQENINGARITLESDANNVPFVITLGIYGLAFHTEFLGELNVATEYFKRKKIEIAEILKLCNFSDENIDIDDELDELLQKLVYN
ncbi:hypothetical protein [uncultured Flavobacterium sp.]|uniref:hypothetical protein n=1 Tax=uncultured Flavobacterium sp. TaxID=165435 RepID=UPI0025FC90A8|nr:hypothetical protein [uncultured Flavobacterium sp.]